MRVADRVVLDALYNATGGRNWSHQRDWLSGEPIGDWYGVTTDGIGRVTALDLYQNHLTGTIPESLRVAARSGKRRIILCAPTTRGHMLRYILLSVFALFLVTAL